MRSPLRTAGVIVVVAVSVLTGVFALGGLGDASTPFDDRVLIATMGLGMGLFGVMLALLGRHDRRVRIALWYLPVFLVLHVVLLGTWLPDAALAVITVSGLVAMEMPAPRAVSAAAG